MLGAKNKTDTLCDCLYRSELIAAKWICGYKIRHSDKFAKTFYNLKELELDPAWLSIEPYYSKQILSPYLDNREGTKLIQAHRHDVLNFKSRVRKSKARSYELFMLRQKLLPTVTEAVLHDYGLNPSDFYIHLDQLPITDPFFLWKRLGTVLQHYFCLHYINGDLNAGRKLGIKTVL